MCERERMGERGRHETTRVYRIYTTMSLEMCAHTHKACLYGHEPINIDSPVTQTGRCRTKNANKKKTQIKSHQKRSHFTSIPQTNAVHGYT